jgi:DinB superfamily
MSLPSLIDAYLEGARLLRQAVAGMNRDHALARPVAGKWSTLEVACHLADIDALDAMRMKRVIAEERPTLFDANETLFAVALAYQQRDLEDEVTLIERTRSQMARILRTLPDSALARPSDYRIGDRVEQRTLQQLLEKAIRHVRHHISFVREKRKALGLA